MPRYVTLLALAACGGANQPAPPQQGARQVVDRSGTVWEPAWDQAGRQYFVDRATGRTSWQIDAAQGAPAPPARPQAPSVSRLRPSSAPQQPAPQQQQQQPAPWAKPGVADPRAAEEARAAALAANARAHAARVPNALPHLSARARLRAQGAERRPPPAQVRLPRPTDPTARRGGDDAPSWRRIRR